MKTQILVLVSLVSGLGILSETQASLQVHEWGTFTSLVGSDGETVNGMYHEDEVLPQFVHGFGEVATAPQPTRVPLPTPVVRTPPRSERPCRGKSCFDDYFYDTNLITQKMETPVIYFYSDRTQDVSVNVKFPNGLLTETYPAPVKTFPTKSQLPVLGNGEMTFDVEVSDWLFGKFPYVEPTNIYSHARNVASNIVRSKLSGESEKFIFYRGLGQFQPKISLTSKNGDITLSASPGNRPQAAFLVDVDSKGHGQMLRLASTARTTVTKISNQTIQALQNHSGVVSPEIIQGAAMKNELVSALVKAGLRKDEASAMIATWEHGYLNVPGLRLLYILPRAEVDRILPLSIAPQPDELSRVFVGRLEVMRDTEEMSIFLSVVAKQEAFDVASLGRFAEARIRRTMDAYRQREGVLGRRTDPSLDRLFESLIVRAQKLPSF